LQKPIFGGIFDFDNAINELAKLTKQTETQDFWNDNQRAAKINRQITRLTERIRKFNDIQKNIEDIGVSIEILKEETDADILNESISKIKQLTELFEKIELQTIFSDDISENNAILNIHPGAGGTESQDWAQMLYRMYMRWCEQNQFETELLDFQPGEEAGIKNVTILVKGQYAYGYLSTEQGVHRLVRISPFDANARRHTSFSAVAVLPELSDDVEVSIREEDLRIDTYRASGAGGQHVNKTESAIRITHLPTGIVVQCQSERSQHKNRANAMKILKAKLYEKMRAEKAEEFDKISGEKTDIAWGHQIRSYIFQPYTLVKDHRTDTEVGNIQAVMDGEINIFIKNYLKYKATTLKK